jgi:TetR/AcrR family transcriptional regulator
VVLRTAEEIFANVGYAGARMEDVAAKVGIRRASLVYYFRDKPALYAAVLDDLFADLLERYEAALSGPGSPRERFLRCLDVWAERVEQRPALLRISLWEIAGAGGVEPVPLASRVRPIVELLAAAVRSGQRDGLIQPDVDPVEFVMSVAGTTAFLGRRSALLDAPVAPAPQPGRLAAELRRWAGRILFVD